MQIIDNELRLSLSIDFFFCVEMVVPKRIDLILVNKKWQIWCFVWLKPLYHREKTNKEGGGRWMNDHQNLIEV